MKERGLLNFVVVRLGQGLLVILLVSFLSFLLLYASPGDCLADLQLNQSLSPEFIAAERARRGLDRPFVEQYGRWLFNLAQGNLGRTCKDNAPVFQLILQRAGNTLLFSLSALISTWLIAIPAGIWAAVNRDNFIDRFMQFISYLLQGFPAFIMVILLLIFAQTSGLFPVGGLRSLDYDDLNFLGKVVDIAYHLALPVTAAFLIGFAGLQRLMRGNLLDVLQEDYVRTARAKGLPETKVIYVHALRNAVNPLVTLLGFQLASLLSGSFITELLFGLPGLGQLLYEAVRQKDTNLAMAGFMLGAVMLVLGNLIADILLKLVDPRIKLDDRG
ncbi:MAG: ABC transporter permease [Pseudanabaenaceae cyanobacterium SKYGB_i_bin29]|nr:ABC transporter permease [Pseudanabaenaceae cyanobacterium SKYG29]MDW8421149.1 ABC transporter permease [Pseudanabaenaceae cyanobacterium SKYGB_i_bin29]